MNFQEHSLWPHMRRAVPNQNFDLIFKSNQIIDLIWFDFFFERRLIWFENSNQIQIKIQIKSKEKRRSKSTVKNPTKTYPWPCFCYFCIFTSFLCTFFHYLMCFWLIFLRHRQTNWDVVSSAAGIFFVFLIWYEIQGDFLIWYENFWFDLMWHASLIWRAVHYLFIRTITII